MAEQSTQMRNRKEEAGNAPQAVERRPTSGGSLRRDRLWSPSEFFEASPLTLMRRFAEQMDRTFSGGWGSDFGRESAGMWMPAVDVSERDGKLIVHADLPGLKKEDVKVEVTDDALIIQGERREEHQENERGYRRSECTYGKFYRSIPLPQGAETDKAKAEFNNGVLEMSVPVPASQRRGREVPIEAATSAERKPSGSQGSGEIGEAKTG